MSNADRLHASYAQSPDQLTSRQLSTVKLLLQRFDAIIGRLRGHSAAPADAERPLPHHMPHHVFLLDGPRGGGKSYTLTTIETLLRALSRDPAYKDLDSVGWLEQAGVAAGANSAFDPRKRAAAHVLRVIFPGDMERGDSLMEAVLAGIRNSLEACQRQFAEAPDDSLGVISHASGARSRLSKLLNGLRQDIARGWYYANQFGIDTIIRDSVDYDDLVSKFEKESGRAAGRAVAWQAFVYEYLDAIGAETLVVMLDDSDAGPELTADILQSTRMFLSHPRIITVLAGNLDSMRGSLIQSAMNRLSSAIGSLGSPGSMENRTARDWRRGHRQLVEEYLDKVLPPANRLYLKPQDAAGDFEKVADDKSLDGYIEDGIKAYRKAFLNVKFRLALGREISERDVPKQDEERHLESYLAWWFFEDRYRKHLAPRTPRQIATFRDFYRDLKDARVEITQNIAAGQGGGEKSAKQPRPKRLVVALFQNPANYLLIQRLADSDDSIPEWLRQQILESSWHGRRIFKINNRELEENGYTHRYLRYRLDVGLGLPIRDNAQAAVPEGLLPRPAGRQLMRRFLQARDMPRRPRSLGLSRWIDHAAIPANCIYFHDLEALPDIAFLNTPTMKPEDAEKFQAGEWESLLSSHIYEVIDDRRGAMNAGEDQNDGDDQGRALKDEYVFRYVREIVCESLRFSNNVKSATLMAELDPPDIAQKQSQAIYEHFIRAELHSFVQNVDIRCAGWWFAFGEDTKKDTKNRILAAKQHQRREVEQVWNQAHEILAKYPIPQQPDADRLKQFLDTLANRFNYLVPESGADTDESAFLLGGSDPNIRPADYRRAIALYCCLFTDLRRAWHAVRIHEAAPSLQPDDDESASHASIAALTNRDRMPLYTRRQLRALLDRSRWTRSVLSVFSQEQILKVVDKNFQAHADKYSGGKRKDKFATDDLKRIFVASLKDISLAPVEGSRRAPLQNSQPVDEKEDFQRWTGTLRNIGRAVCDGWPVHDLDLQEAPVLEREIFERAAQLPQAGGDWNHKDARILVLKKDVASETGNRLSDNATRKRQRSNARQARKLVWLLHGVAPSLPAIIHAEIMSIIYQVSLLEKAANDSRFELSAKAKMKQTADDLKRDANKEITAWADLIGTLSVIMRYIKIKALHLDISFILREALGNLKRGANDVTAREISDLLKVSGYDKLFKDSFNVETIVSRLVCRFEGTGDTVADESAMNVDLSTFPDVAPSTLFGERWVKDILARKGLKKKISDETAEDDPSLDSGISVNGVFGETEQWLWTANRGLRKLRAVLHEKWEVFFEDGPVS
jgi:hypothetical protein